MADEARNLKQYKELPENSKSGCDSITVMALQLSTFPSFTFHSFEPNL